MSHTSLFEEAAINTAAISLLNKFRHVIQGRSGIVLSQNERSIITNSLTINEPDKLSDAIIYSLQGSGNDLSGSIPSIGSAISKVLDMEQGSNSIYIELIKKSIAENKLTNNDCEQLILFIEKVMKVIAEESGNIEEKNPFEASTF